MMKLLLVLFAFMCLSSAFPEYTADVLRFELPASQSGVGKSHDVKELAQILQLDKFLQLLEQSGLQETIFVQGPFTLFAPTDDAFGNMPEYLKSAFENDMQLLTDVLLYHTIETMVNSSGFKNELVLPSRLESASVRINTYKKLTTVNGCPISKPDNVVNHGVIHVIDRVMFPIPMSDIATIVANNFEVSTFMEAVRAAGLKDALKGGPYTLFLPTNDAFHKLPYGTLESILGDKEKLRKVINNHLLKETLFSVGFEDKNKITTVEKNELTIGISDDQVITVGKAKVIYADDTATNGVIHAIDTVLIPDDMKYQLVMV